MKKKKIIAVIVIALCIILVFLYVSKRKPPPPKQMRVPVTVDKAMQKDMPVEIREIGTVEGYKSVPVYSRVVGQLVKIHFKEGQDVSKGQPLFTIDPSSYQEKLRQAEARLLQDIANMKFSKDEAKRYKYLFDKGAASRSDYENKQSVADAQEALVAADKASVDDARLQLTYCYISAPFDGRMGAYGAFEGRMIKDNDTQLSTINQITPVYASFSVPEKELSAIRKYAAAGKLKVTAIPPGYTGNPPEGELTFIDNTVNVQTGMILLKATFLNKDRFLWPGQYVNVVLTLTMEKNVVVVPERSVQLSQTGKYTFVVKPDNKAEYRLVTTDRTIGGLTVVTKGVSAGETVVTDGHFKLKDGFPVEIRDSLTSGQDNTNNAQTKPSSQQADTPAKPKTEGSSGTKK